MVDKFEKYGLTIQDYIPMCITQPQLFYQSPETLNAYAEEIAKLMQTIDSKIRILG